MWSAALLDLQLSDPRLSAGRVMPRQLALPGVSAPKPPPARVTAKRDFKPDEFARALERLGFRQVGAIRFVDLRASRWRYIEAVYRVNPIRIARRATLAKLLRSRKEA